MNRSNSNVGKQIMILQQQLNHKKKMKDIYYKSTSNLRFSDNQANQYSYLHKTGSKKNQFKDQQHNRNIRHLYEILSRQKTISDRLKDPQDFFTFPVYFFRYDTERTLLSKKKSVKNSGVKKLKSQQKQNRVLQNLSIDKIKQYIPFIQEFGQEDLDLIADGIHKIIITFDIMNLNQIFKLQDVVLALIPKAAPPQFIECVEKIFYHISQQFKK